MARITIDGLEDVVQQMASMGQLTGKVADEMLYAGSEEMTTAWKNNIAKTGLVKTGTMYRSVKPTKIKTVPSGKAIEVYPQGTDRNNRKKPVRNAEKAFVLHYGKRSFAGTHFVDQAMAEGEPLANKAMEKRWDEFIEKGK